MANAPEQGARLLTGLREIRRRHGYRPHEQLLSAARECGADVMLMDTPMAAAKPDMLFMHCLPVHRGERVTAGVIDEPQSVTACMRKRR